MFINDVKVRCIDLFNLLDILLEQNSLKIVIVLLITFRTLTTSFGNCINAALVTLRYILSTNIPARIACATDRNFGFSSVLRLDVASCLVKVDASHSRTSGGTASGCTSLSSSSSSTKRL